MSTNPEKMMPIKNKKMQINIPEKERDLVLSHKDAEAASPDYEPVCGEEDPGAALETLVTKDEGRK